MCFHITFIIYELDGDVMWMQYIGLIVLFLFGFIIKPYLLIHDEKGYSWSDFMPCFTACTKVTLLSVVLSYFFYMLIGKTSILSSIFVFIASFISVLLSSCIFMEKNMRNKMIIMVRYFVSKQF